MAKPKGGRIFVIGLDGATYDLIDPWVRQGELPTFARLFNEGMKGELASVVPPITTPAWASFLTGKRPATHGLFSWVTRKGTCGMEPSNKTHIRGETLSDIFTRHRLKIGLVNVPCTYPPTPVEGFVVTGLETPSRESAFTYPETLKEDLISKFDYEVERTQKFRRGNEKRFVETVENVERKRAEAVLHLMKEREWKFFMVVFRGTDILSHCSWRHLDPNHPSHVSAEASRFGTILLDHYKLMDDTVGRIWDQLDERDTLVLMSDHGSCGFWRYIYLDNLLVEEGLMHFRRSPRWFLRRWLFHLGITPSNTINLLAKLRVWNLIRRLVPQDLRLKVTDRVLLGSAVDWSKTVAFPFGGMGQIYINLEGREEQGCVRGHKEYEEVAGRVIRALERLVEPLTGEPMVRRVLRKEELGADLMDRRVPDLYVEWTGHRYGDIGGIGVSKGRMSDIQVDFCGFHTMRGIFLAVGPAFKKKAALEGARIIDLAPTLLHLLDLPIPQDMEGRVLTDAYLPQFIEKNPVRYESPRGPGEREEHTFSDEEKDLVENRLRDLGYMS